ncbi:MAG TPA: TlpA disulfide reductase family protein [Flavipsychrobacter sp.]|nr:TlpA disulfide reductase family protein [Flavipsychrobacter sp.]
MKLKFLSIATLCFCYFPTWSSQLVKLHGKIEHPIADSVIVSFNIDKINYKLQIYGAKLKSDGSFSLEFPVKDKITELEIDHGNQTTDLFVEPGYDLNMTVDASDFDKTLHYEGKGKDIANFTAKHVLEMGALGDYGAKIRPLYVNNPDDFEKGVAEQEQKEIDFLDDNKRNLPSSFNKYWENLFTYDGYKRMLIYAPLHEMRKKQKSFVPLKDYDKESFNVVAHVPQAFSDNLLLLPQYRDYVDNYYAFTLMAHGIENDSTNPYRMDDSMIKLSYKNMPPKTAEYFIARVLCVFSKNYSYQRELKLFAEYKKHFPKSEYKATIEEQVVLKKKMQSGSTDFKITDINGKEVRLSDLKGKVVFLDFWASWCTPCIGQIPYIHRVEDHFKNDDNVVFLNISIDNDEAAWKGAISKYRVSGINARDKGGWNGPVASLYNIKSVPTYLLIDKKGHMASDIPMPNQTDALIEKIQKLLQ